MDENEIFVHPTATVHPQAQLDSGVKVGPYSLVDQHVIIHKNTSIEAHATFTGWTEIGENCRFSAFSSFGGEPQDLTYRGEETRLRIGNDNVFREFATVHRGTAKGRGETAIGDSNYFMALSHVAHDCLVGTETVFLHAATLGGHVVVEDFSTVGAWSGVHQFCRVGKYAYIGGYSVITQDVLPFCRVAGGRPTYLYGMNAIGLRRRGFSRESIKTIKDIFNIFFYSDLNTNQALERIEEEIPPGSEKEEILRFIRDSKRGIVKKAGEKWEEDLV
jgi:UDP-N-acetylglucosamine acyltransferase